MSRTIRMEGLRKFRRTWAVGFLGAFFSGLVVIVSPPRGPEPAQASTVVVGSGICAQTVSTSGAVTVSGPSVSGVCTITFDYGANPRIWTVPTGGLTNVSFTIKGGSGGGSTSGTRVQTRGAEFSGTISSLAGGESVYVYVAERGHCVSSGVWGGAWGGGGSGNNGSCAGGGSTEIRIGDTFPSGGAKPSGKKIVAGGGGGASGAGGCPTSGTYPGCAHGQDANGASAGARGWWHSSTACSGYDGAVHDPNAPDQWGSGLGGNANNCRNASSGGGGYAGGGAGSNISGGNDGGDGGRGSSYIESGFAVATNASQWRGTGAAAGSGFHNGYDMYTNFSSNGQLVLSYTPTTSSVSQQPSNGVVGVALSTQPQVTLQSGGAAVAGVTVTAALGTSPSPSGTQNSPALAGTLTAVTNASGVATFSNLAINGPIGSYTLSFTATGYPTATSNNLTLSVGVASALKVSTQPSSGGTSGGVIPGAPAVTVVDAGGNAITSHPATSVSVTASPGTIGGTTSVNTSSGVASFTAATLTGVISPTTHTLTFSASGLTSATTSAFTLGAGGSAAGLAIGTQPVANVGIGTNFSTQPVVRVVDAGGNVVTSHPATVVTAAIASGSSSGSLPVTTATTSSGVATYSGFKMNGAGGDFTVTFSAPGLGSVTSAMFSVNRTAQSITFNSLSTKTFGDAAFRITATASSNLVVAFTSSTPTVCSVAGDRTTSAGSATAAVVTLLGAGTCTISANQSGNDNFAVASQQTQSFTVNPGSQATLTLTNASTVNFGSALTLAASGGSGTGAVTYALVGGAGTAQCVLNMTTGAMTFGSAGTCTVQAQKAADTNYTVKQSSQQVLTVARAPQSTAFTSVVPANPLPGGSYVVTATASSGLVPTVAVLAGAGTVCSLSGLTLNFLASGTCSIIASQAGNGNYLSASPEAEQTIVVGSLNQSITFAQPTNMNFGDPNKRLSVSSSSSLSVSLTSLSPSVCAVTGEVVSIVSVGKCEVKASQGGNSRFAAASDVIRTFEIVAVVPTAPTIRSASVSSGAFTVGFSAPGFDGGSSILAYRLVATPTGSGTTVSDDSCVTTTCTITGLTNGTEYTVTVTAINSAGVGAASSASPAMTPVANALAVQALLSTPGDGQLTISWTAPADLGGGAFVQYEVRLRQSGSTWPVPATQTVTTSASGSVNLTGLDNGTEYEVQVITITAANSTSYEGNTAMVAAIPRRVPSAPRSLTATETAATSALVTWAVPVSDGGAVIASYSVSFSGGVSCGTVTIALVTKAGSCTATGLAYSTTYSISVVAVNAAGSSVATTVSHSTQAAPVTDVEDPSGSSSTTTSSPATTLPTSGPTTTVSSRSKPTATTPKSSSSTSVPGSESDEDGDSGSGNGGSGGNSSPTIGALAPLLSRSGPMVVMSVEGTVATPKTSISSSAVSIIGSGVAVEIEPMSGTKLGDTTSGRVMICGAGAMSFSLTGLQPQSMVVVWLRQPSTQLTDKMTNEEGSVDFGVQLPTNLDSGDHEMQVDMVTAKGQRSSMAAGLNFEPICSKRKNPIDGGTLLVGFSVLALGFLLVVGFRRRRRDEALSIER